jgi:AcrR family transcriptional regulator
MSRITKRQYVSKVRSRRADVTRTRVLNAAKKLFMRHGIDRATMAEIADKAKVAVPTVYALYKSKEGILRALMESALFGPRFQEARAKLDGVADPVWSRSRLTSRVRSMKLKAPNSVSSAAVRLSHQHYAIWSGNSRRFASRCNKNE